MMDEEEATPGPDVVLVTDTDATPPVAPVASREVVEILDDEPEQEHDVAASGSTTNSHPEVPAVGYLASLHTMCIFVCLCFILFCRGFLFLVGHLLRWVLTGPNISF